MKKRLLPITILAALGMSALIGCGGGGQPAVVDVTGVTLNETSVSLYKGATKQLEATVQPANASDKTVTWKSNATSVVTVSEEGLVSAVDVGRATVTVQTNDGGYKATCEFIVTLNMESISITNKDAFEGILPGENKTLSISGNPEFNATVMLNKGFLHLSSSDEEVASITALNVYALKEGKTTITAELFGKTDSFELTVEHKGTNKERFGTDHEGDAADPFTNEDALKAAKWLEENGGFGTDAYYFKGEVASFYHAPGSRTDGVVSYFLKPATEGGEKFEVYKTLKKDGSALTDDEIWVNGTAVAYGPFAKYGSQYETASATFVSCEGNKPEPRQTIESSLADAIAYVKTLDDGADTYDYYQFEGYATRKTGDDVFLTATKGEAIEDTKVNTIQLYGACKDADVAALLMKNAKVKCTMVLKNYHGQAENLFTVKAADIVVLEEGEPWVVNYNEVTFAQALEAAKALADGATSPDLYKFEGIVKEVTGAWSDQYKNMNFTMYAEGDNAVNPETLTIFRVVMDDGIDHTKVVAGAKVTVGGNLQNYVKDDAHTYELVNGKVLAIESGEIPTETWVKVTEQPIAGQGYKLILDREENASNPGLWFLKDELESEAKDGGKDYYIMTSNNSEESANVELINAEGGFQVKIGARYLKIFQNGTYINAGLADAIADATVLQYDLTNGFGAVFSEAFWGLGTRNDKGYTTAGAVNFTQYPDNYKVCLYVEGEEPLPPEPAAWEKLDAAPVEGEEYRLILDREENESNPGLWFLKDELESEAKDGGKDYYITTSADEADGAAVEVIAVEGGLKAKIGARYLNIFKNGTYINAGLVATAEEAAVLEYDLTNGFGVTIEEKFWGLGTRNDKGYTTAGAVNFTQYPDNYKVCLYKQGGEPVPPQPQGEVVDLLNQSVTGVTGTQYTDFSGKKVSSEAVYAGQCAGGNSSIQLRSKNSNSGVVSTASGGLVRKVVIVWEGNTLDGRTLNVYGSNTAYTAATELYDEATQGTLLGTIVKGTSTELVISGDYAFIGFRSAADAMYITSISITWEA